MPRIKRAKNDYMVRDELKQLHGQLLAEGISNKKVGEWLDISGQCVGQHFKNASFSYRQVRVMETGLAEVREANRRKGV